MDVKSMSKHFNDVPIDGPVRKTMLNKALGTTLLHASPATPGASSDTPTVFSGYASHGSQH